MNKILEVVKDFLKDGCPNVVNHPHPDFTGEHLKSVIMQNYLTLKGKKPAIEVVYFGQQDFEKDLEDFKELIKKMELLAQQQLDTQPFIIVGDEYEPTFEIFQNLPDGLLKDTILVILFKDERNFKWFNEQLKKYEH